MSISEDKVDLMYNLAARSIKYDRYKSYFEGTCENTRITDLLKNDNNDFIYKNIKKEYIEMYKYDYCKFVNYHHMIISKFEKNDTNILASVELEDVEILHPFRLYILGDKKSVANIKTIKVYNSGHEIYNYPMKLLINAFIVKEKESLDELENMIKIDVSNFPYLLSPMGKIKFIIDFYESFDISIDISLKSKIIVMDNQNSLLKYPKIEEIVNAINYKEFKFDPSTDIRLSIDEFNRLSNGLFILGDVCDIISIVVRIGELELIYSKQIIDSVCDKINDNTLFLPFNSMAKYWIITSESYLNGIEFGRCRMGECFISFMFEHNQSDIAVYNNEINILSHRIIGEFREFGILPYGFLGELVFS